jgi:hypothetical protein
LNNSAVLTESDPLERMMRLRDPPALRDLKTALPEPRLPERPGALDRHRRPQDADAGRDAARLNRRSTHGARTDNV